MTDNELDVISFFVQKYAKACDRLDREEMAKKRNQINLLLDSLELKAEAKPPTPQTISVSAMMPTRDSSMWDSWDKSNWFNPKNIYGDR